MNDELQLSEILIRLITLENVIIKKGIVTQEDISEEMKSIADNVLNMVLNSNKTKE